MCKDVVIIGGGISGLSALHYIQRDHPEYKVRLFEANNRVGGVIGADYVQGYLCEWGPSSLRDRDGIATDLCRELGIEDKLCPAGADAKFRYILRDGKLRILPYSPGTLISSRALSTAGKLRALWEPFADKGIEPDETISEFATRRFGKEIAEYLIQPLVTGIFAGDSRELSVRSCFPPFFDLEQEHGSLIKGMFAKRKTSNKRSGKKSSSMTSLTGGVNTLVKTLHTRYSKQIVTGAKATHVSRENSRYAIEFSGGRRESADELVIALPAHHAASVLKGVSSELAETLNKITYAPVTVVCLGYSAEFISHTTRGFGYLVPQVEQAKHLGAIWSSSVFPEQAPEGKTLFRVLIGGANQSELMNLSDSALERLAAEELSATMGISTKQEMTRIFRWIQAVPQYRVGHHQLISNIDAELEKTPGLYLTGNAYTGVGIVDCLERSSAIARNLC